MKLKAPAGVGDPCVAGVSIVPRDGVYEVKAEIGALLIECFGFVEVGVDEKAKAAPAAVSPRRRAPGSLPKLRHPAWRSQAAVKKSWAGGIDRWPRPISLRLPT